MGNINFFQTHGNDVFRSTHFFLKISRYFSTPPFLFRFRDNIVLTSVEKFIDG